MLRCENDDELLSKRFGFIVQDECWGRIAAKRDFGIRGSLIEPADKSRDLATSCVWMLSHLGIEDFEIAICLICEINIHVVKAESLCRWFRNRTD